MTSSKRHRRIGEFSEETLAKFQEMCAEKQGLDFSEGDTYDFAKCLMPNGDVYGVEPGETCKMGKPISDQEAKGKGKSDTSSRMAKLKRAFIKKVGRKMTDKEIAKAERMIGVKIPKGESAESMLQKMLPKGEKVVPVREA